MNKTLISVFTVSILLTGCGSDSDEPDLSGVDIYDPYISSLSGVRYVTRTTNGHLDESYLSIDKSGNITVYDYQGDGVGTGQNCYTYATEPSQINSMLHRGKITYTLVPELPEDFDPENDYEQFIRLRNEHTRFKASSHPDVGDFHITFNHSKYGNQMFEYNYKNLYFSTNLGATNVATGYNFMFITPENAFFEPGNLLASDLEAAMCD